MALTDDMPALDGNAAVSRTRRRTLVALAALALSALAACQPTGGAPAPAPAPPATPTAVAPPAPAPAGSYTYMATQTDGAPVRYDPCSVIHYVVNAAGAPAGSEAVVHAAVQRIADQNGLRFVYDGSTTEVPTLDRELYQARYGIERIAPVIVAWVGPNESDVFAGRPNVIGLGGSTLVASGNGPRRYVTGAIWLNEANTGGYPTVLGSGTTLGNLVQHELGHVIGLGHSNASTELMYPVLTGAAPDGYGQYDKVGLVELGTKRGCFRAKTRAARIDPSTTRTILVED